MRKVFLFSFICVLSGLMLIACQRDESVRAGNEQGTDTYQPRPAPQGQVTPATPATPGMPGATGQLNQDIRGELTRVDMNAKTITVRLANGVDQTFKFDDMTMVMGLEQSRTTKPGTATGTGMAMRSLVGKEGSEVSVQWIDQNGAKTAAHINIVQLNATRKGPRKK